MPIGRGIPRERDLDHVGATFDAAAHRPHDVFRIVNDRPALREFAWVDMGDHRQTDAIRFFHHLRENLEELPFIGMAHAQGYRDRVCAEAQHLLRAG